MRILYVTSGIAPFRLGGMQAVARMHVEGLAARGVDVAVVHPGPAADPVAEGQRLPGRVHVLTWPRLRGLRGRIPGHYTHELRKYSQMVLGVVQQEQPNVVYADGPLLHALLTASPPHRTPTVFHPHGLEMFQDLGALVDNLRSRPLRALTRLHCRRATIVISQGGLLNDLITGACGATSSQVREVPNALHESSVVCQPATKETPVRFLFVGRDEPRKGLRVLLHALPQISGAELHIVGPHRAVHSKATEGTTWHGEVRERTRLWDIFDSCHYLVLPSFAEGMPTVLLEAMARGLPVLASNVGAVSAVVEQGHTGWLLPPGNVARLIDAMTEAVALSSQEYQAMSSAALGLIRDRYLHDHACNHLLAVLREAIGMTSL